MLDQCIPLIHRLHLIVTHSPDVICRGSGYADQSAVVVIGPGAGDYLPLAATPMFSKRLHISVSTNFAYSPDVTSGNCSYTVEHVSRIARSALRCRTRAWTWDHAPFAAFPM